MTKFYVEVRFLDDEPVFWRRQGRTWKTKEAATREANRIEIHNNKLGSDCVARVVEE